MGLIAGGPGLTTHWWDKVPSKFEGWSEADFRKAGFRADPGSIVRRGAYVAPGAELMPSFVTLGAHVGQGTMVDSSATAGSCAQIGENGHLSGCVGISCVLEPLQAGAGISAANRFLPARSVGDDGRVCENGGG